MILARKTKQPALVLLPSKGMFMSRLRETKKAMINEQSHDCSTREILALPQQDSAPKRLYFRIITSTGTQCGRCNVCTVRHPFTHPQCRLLSIGRRRWYLSLVRRRGRLGAHGRVRLCLWRWVRKQIWGTDTAFYRARAGD